tara:strand:- start:649 stop:993 length:345 start_codon:yes stop_codon:yes gene_type:complete
MVQTNLKPVFISGATTVAPENKFFKAITVLALNNAGDTISVKGGISQGLDADDSDGSSHLDSAGSSTLGATHAAGIYEMLPTVAAAINVPAGTTIYGRFTEVAVGAGDSVIAYL